MTMIASRKRSMIVDYTLPTAIAFTEGVPNTVTVKGEIDLKPFVRMEPDTAKSKLTWTTSDKKIATVKKGTVTGKAPRHGDNHRHAGEE